MKEKGDKDSIILHGSSVLLRGATHAPSAVFIRGLSGSGKSDLAFRLIEKGAALICDDQVVFTKRRDKILVSAVESIRGLLEVRGVGLMRYPAETSPQELRLVVNLVRREDVPRLPEWKKVDILGVGVPSLEFHAFDVSAATKLMKAMEAAHQPGMII